MTVTKKIILDVETKGAQKNVKKLDKGIKDTAKSSKGAEKGLKGMTGGTKALGLGFKALGIGLIISAFMKLKDLFSGNIETARKFEVMGAKISAMFDVLRDRIEPLFMSLSKLFTDPLGSLETFANAIKENLINRVKALVDTFGALGKVVKGVFTRDMDLLKEGVNQAKDSFVQLSTGLDDVQQSKVAETFKSITKEIKEETKAVGDLTEALQNVRDRERDMLTVRADANKLIAQSRLLAEDESKSMEERLVALKAAVAEEQRVASIEMSIQEDKVNALQEIIDLGKSSEEDMQNLAAEKARLTELETASILKQKRVVTEIVTFEKQIDTEKKKIAKAELDRQNLLLQTRELNLEITEELTDKELEALIKAEEKRLGVIDANSKKEKELKEKQIEDVKKMELESAMNIMGSLAQLGQQKLSDEKKALQKQLDAGLISQKEFDKESAKIEKESVKREKKNAMLNILISTAQGIAGAIKAGAGLTFPANLGAIASGVAAVLAGIVNAKAVLSKVPGDGGSADIDAGTTGGDDSVEEPEVGGIQGIASTLLPNINNTNTDQQPIQAYVIENDISDAQALQEELEIQATL
tara:strand:- start:14483 stop:16240 length:1758 start_codon:yes stop_codon:yes gene_type:complete